jgi:hypothetical protein
MSPVGTEAAEGLEAATRGDTGKSGVEVGGFEFLDEGELRAVEGTALGCFGCGE